MHLGPTEDYKHPSSDSLYQDSRYPLSVTISPRDTSFLIQHFFTSQPLRQGRTQSWQLWPLRSSWSLLDSSLSTSVYDMANHGNNLPDVINFPGPGNSSPSRPMASILSQPYSNPTNSLPSGPAPHHAWQWASNVSMNPTG